MQIVVEPNGDMNFTRKPHLLDLVGDIGRKSITRMTDIRFDERQQLFYIHFLTGPFADKDLTEHLSLREQLASNKSAFWYFVTEYRPGDRQTYLMPGTPTVFFGTYEAAVDFEVEFVEFLRVLGYTMDA